MSFADVITGHAVGAGFWSAYGTYTGSDGKIVTYLNGLGIPLTPILWLLVAAGVYLIIRDARKDGIKGIGFPLGLVLVLSNFMFKTPFSLYLLYGAVIALSVFLFIRAKNLSQGGFFGMLALIVGISYFIFGNLITLPVVGGACAIIFWIIKMTIRRKERGSSAERGLEHEAGFDTHAEDKALRREQRAEREAHRRGELGKTTEDAAEQEERNIELEVHTAALAAGAEVIGKKMTDLDNAELKAEERDAKVLDFAATIDRHIKQHSMESDDDAKKTSDLKADAKQLVMIMGELVKDEKYADEYREQTIKAIEHTTGVMKDAISRAVEILSSEIRVEDRLEHRLKSVTGHIKKQMEKKEKELAKLASEESHASGEVRERIKAQLENLGREMDLLKRSVEEIDRVGEKARDVLKKGHVVLRKMKGQARKMQKEEDEIESFAANMEKFEAHIGEHVSDIRDAFKEFQKAMSSLDRDALPEEVIMKASSNVSRIFEISKNFIDKTIEFNQNEILPFVEKNQELLKDCWRIEEAADFGNKVSRKVASALENLAKMAEAASMGDSKGAKAAQDMIKIDEFQEKLANYADWKTNKIKSEVKQAYGDLGKSVDSVRSQISYLEKEKSSLDYVEKETVGSLDAAMRQLTDIRRRQAAQFQEAAKKAESDLSKAKRFERKEKAAA